MRKHGPQYEQAYVPIFEYLIDPTKITFEDDILANIKNFIETAEDGVILFTMGFIFNPQVRNSY